MKFNRTLSFYLTRQYVVNLLVMIAVLWAIIYLFDTVELLRRTGSQSKDISPFIAFQMGLYKLPEVGVLVFPFAVLFSGIFTFWQLNRRQELIVVRVAGFSIWQFLTPLLTVGIFVGVITTTVINPLGTIFLSKFEVLENSYLKHNASQAALLEEGLWLRQAQKNTDNYVIMNAASVQLPEWDLSDVTLLVFNKQDDFLRRVDAQSASLEQGQWLFKDTIIHDSGVSQPVDLKALVMATDITIDEIEESFASAETTSFWKLPAFIQRLDSKGFDSTKLRVHFQTLLAQPFLFIAMILLAAAVALKPPRQGGTFLFITVGVAIGFVTFFMSSFLNALGASQQIPVFLAAWSTPFILLLFGTTLMLMQEDG